ncbi:MAG: hypothetical protein M1165_00565 [Candidatus Pacearchaeota archaeon]|nr:hypothetical protein [Candidatus Pacearchaeota archaeon]
MEVKEGITYLTVPHEGGKTTFQYPAFGGYIGDIAESIDRAGLRRSSSPETASLVYDASKNPKGKYESEVLKILNERWLWEFTGNLYLPKSDKKEDKDVNNGVIIEYNPQIENNRAVMNRNSLVRRLNNNDPNVKFVPFGFKTGEQSFSELGKNPYIIARYGEEGAEKIAEVASKYKFKPVLWSFDSVNEETARLSALSGNWNVGGLDVVGYWGGNDDGRSFGVLKD